MDALKREVDANFVRFTDSWTTELSSVIKEIDTDNGKFVESYRRLVSLQAWKSELLERALGSGALSFFTEAQNDGLSSHVLARVGAWRSALKSLRSCIENTMAAMYYKDHPIELRLWEQGKHKVGFTELSGYFEKHPDVSGTDRTVTGLDILEKEYGTLSRAVHGSATSFRMTSGDKTLLWSPDRAKLGAWSTRESQVIRGVNLLCLSLFKDEVSGVRHSNLRKAISLAIPLSLHTRIRTSLGIALSRP
ncbi:MAG TPA: hypothetical protein VFQ39_15705 [Longimicrobium sp.]|nr:hypothetical protein [Longimicrobium sp.]